MITIDDFAKVEIRVGTVLEAEKVPDADKLIRLIFDFGDLSEENNFEVLPELGEKYPGKHVRQVMSAIAEFYPDTSALVGKQIAICTNLEFKKFRGYDSQGMIMAADNEEGVVLMIPEKKVAPGVKLH